MATTMSVAPRTATPWRAKRARVARGALFCLFLYPVLLWPLLSGQQRAPQVSYLPAAPSPSTGALNLIFFPAILAVCAVLYVRDRKAAWPAFSVPGAALVLGYVAWALLSTLWSFEPDITLRRAVLQAIIVSGVILASLQIEKSADAYSAAFLALLASAVVNAVAVLLRPAGPIGHEGIYLHKNELGLVAALILLASVAHFRLRSLLTIFPPLLGIAISIWLLIASESKTSLAFGILCPMIAAGLIFASRRLAISPAIAFPFGIGAGLLIYEFGVQSLWWDFHAMAVKIFGDPTLTSRTDIWRFGVQLASEHPWLGCGYEAVWAAGPNSPSLLRGEGFVRGVFHAHNGYLEVVLRTGAIGLALVLATVVHALHQAGRLAMANTHGAYFALTCLVFLTFYNLLEVTWYSGFSPGSLLLTLIACRRR